ncbi:MAG: hypothetical protein IJS67_01415 [Clostridia bacterium]|nr:hypothetical protein [Clostridia bacterium]
MSASFALSILAYRLSELLYQPRIIQTTLEAASFAPLSAKVRGMNLYSVPLTFTKIACKIRRFEYRVSKRRYRVQIYGKANAVVYEYYK